MYELHRGRDYHDARIVIVDDLSANVELLQLILEQDGYRDVIATTDPRQTIGIFESQAPDLLLLDLHMPHMDGQAVLRELRPRVPAGTYFPVLILTGDSTGEAKERALSSGATDFLTKPYRRTEVLLRIKNQLETRFLYQDMAEHNQRLESTVKERTQELERAQLEILERLALAAEYRDDMVGQHAYRVAKLSGWLAEAMGLPPSEVILTRHAAMLHDIGKIGVPDHILLKDGKYSPEEYDQMKQHTLIGSRIVSGSTSALLQVAQVVALTHHERWDGRGYPNGLSGDSVPLPGRIVAVADVFDALTHRRSYKPAWPVAEAVDEIQSQSGKQFDPEVVCAFQAVLERPNFEELTGNAAETVGHVVNVVVNQASPIVVNDHAAIASVLREVTSLVAR